MHCYPRCLRQAYPMDERQWLLATAYNTGTECLQSVNVIPARTLLLLFMLVPFFSSCQYVDVR